MNLNPIPFFASKALQFGLKFSNTGGRIAAATRETDDLLGVWSGPIGGFIPHQVNPFLYEALREAIGLLDGSIRTLVTLDGIVGVEGDNDRLVGEIEDFIESVPVNDADKGLNAFYVMQGNEVYEQGCSIGEWMPTRDGRDIAGLRVADSKGIAFRRGDRGLECWYRPAARSGRAIDSGAQTVEALLRNRGVASASWLTSHEFTQLDAARLVYVANDHEADNPYGTSKMRSLEFVGQLLVKIENATARVWERYGDPPMHVKYNTKNPAAKSQAWLDQRKLELQMAVAQALRSKGVGNSADLVTALGALDEIAVDILGAQGLALEIDKPAAHVTNEIIAKMGVPGWALGLDTGGSGPTERQSEMVLQASRTRWALRKPYLTGLVSTMLRMRGRTWKRGDWRLKQELPNLQDMMKVAQANFLNAQAAMVSAGRNGENNTPAPRGIDNNLRAPRSRSTHKHGGAKADEESEPWAETDPRLPRIERQQTARQLLRWWALARGAAQVLGFNASDREFTPGPGMGEAFTAPEAAVPNLLALGARFTEDNSGEDAPLLRASFEAWLRGWANGADDVDGDADGYLDIEDAVRQQFIDRAGELVSNATGRAYTQRIVNALASGEFEGLDPVTVAAEVRRRFEVGEYDWERLITSEMAIAQSRGKLDVYRAEGVELYDWTTAGSGVCPTCTRLERDGPYVASDPNSPVPVVDSHPMCRCSISPHVPE